MLTVAEARSEVMSRARPLPAVRTPLMEALGGILDEDVACDLDSPPFPKALVDGYALRASDWRGDAPRFRVVEEILAGQTPRKALLEGEASLVMTGAPIPEHADAVVMIEQSRTDGEFVVLTAPAPTPGRNCLPRGREMRAGEIVLPRGTRLSAAALGLAATVGREALRVIPRPTVTVLSTGNELVEPGQAPGPGQIRNSNTTLLRALCGGLANSVTCLPTAPDELAPLQDALRIGLQSRVLLVTGGVSAGKKDLVPGALAALGVEQVFHKIKLKPGKPLWFGVGSGGEGDDRGPLVFALPGNPVSGVVGFLLFVRPALLALAGVEDSVYGGMKLRLGAAFRHAGDRPTYHPSRLARRAGEEGQEVVPLEWGGSADLRTVAHSDGFAVFPAGDRVYEAGEIVRFVPLS